MISQSWWKKWTNCLSCKYKYFKYKIWGKRGIRNKII